MERLDFSEATNYNAIEASIHLNRYLSAKKFVTGKKVLDIACGEGYGTFLLKKWGAFEVTGVDISEEALAVAEYKFSGKGITFLNHTAEELPFEDDSFDVVVSYETVEHLDHPEKFLAEINRVVRNDGTIIVSCPNDPYYYKQENYSNPYHKRKYTWFDFNKMSVKYLGNNVKWYLGFAMNGFMTIPQDESSFPDKNDLSELNMEELFRAKENNSSWLIPADRFINHWNANYFLGIWGNGNEDVIKTTVSFPREFFIEPDDPVFADIAEWTKQWNEEKKEFERNRQKLNETIAYEQNVKEELTAKYNAIQAEKEQINIELTAKYDAIRYEKEQMEITIEAYKQENVGLTAKYNAIQSEQEKLKALFEEEKLELKTKNDDLVEEIRVTNIQERRTSALLEVANIEKAQLWERINCYEQIIREKEETIAELGRKITDRETIKEKEIADKEKMITEVINHEDELQIKVGELQTKVDEFDRYKRSISYKLMQPVRKVWDVIRFWRKS